MHEQFKKSRARRYVTRVGDSTSSGWHDECTSGIGKIPNGFGAVRQFASVFGGARIARVVRRNEAVQRPRKPKSIAKEACDSQMPELARLDVAEFPFRVFFWTRDCWPRWNRMRLRWE